MLKLAIALLLLADGVYAQSTPSPALTGPETTDFFVCGSSWEALNGHYVLSDERQSDEQTPVFVREDDGRLSHEGEHDFRLYRHNGFWLLADVAAWPPKTHFRCDPTKRHSSSDVDVTEACGINLPTPPLLGYSSVDPKLARDELVLHHSDCASLLTFPKVEL